MGRPTGLRLERISVIRYRMPLKRAYGTARGVTRSAINFLVQLTATDGERIVEGVGECQPRHLLTGDGGKNRVAAWGFLRAAADHLQGRSIHFTGPADAIEAVRAQMAELGDLAASHADDSNRDRPFRGTLLGIEVALLDVAAQWLDLQIAELLGKQRDEIGISISTISSSTRLEAVADKAIKQVRYPMTRVKGTGDNDYNLQLLDVVARANRSVGREKPLWIDINEALDYPGAADLLRRLAGVMASGALPTSIVVEGMLPKSEVGRLPDLQRLADSECERHLTAGTTLDLRIMPDEGLWDRADLTRLNALGGCRAINIKAPKAGGLIESLDLARAAVAANPDIHISLGGMLGTSDITAWALHNLARALPRVDYLTAVPPQNVKERIATPVARYVSPESNLIAPQTAPGLGTRLRMDRLAPYIEDSYSPSTHEAAEPTGSASPVGSRTLVFAGDTSLGDVYVRRQGGSLAERLEHRPMSFFEGLRPLVAEHDAFILNLETVLADAPESPFEGRKPFLGWDSPARTISCLQQLGVDAVSLANNHTMDFGEEHLLATRTRLEEAGISTFGAGTSRDEAARPLTLSFEFGDVTRRVHIIGAMQVQAKLRDEYGFYAGRKKAGVNGLSLERTSAAIAQLRAMDPSSLIIVFPHWGRNYQWAGDRLQKAATALTQAGADLILGHGAHMIQQCTFANTSAVVYSLGNFQFNWGGRFGTLGAPPYGMVARVAVAPVDERWHVDLRLYPFLSDNRRTDHDPTPVAGEHFDAVWTMLSKQDIDGSFNRCARAERDSLGNHIRYTFTTISQQSKDRLLTTAAPSSIDQTTPNQYDDPASIALHEQLGRWLLSSALIRREAERAGAKVERLSSDTFLAELSGRRLLFVGNRCTESVPAARLVKDKAIVKQLLQANSVGVPVGRSASSWDEAVAILRELGKPVVVKPRRGDRGADVTVGVESLADLRAAFDQANSHGGVLIEEVVQGQEYRCLCTPTDVIAAYQKAVPTVRGDGRSTIGELIARRNEYRAANPALLKKPIVVGDDLINFLAKSDLTVESVPAVGQLVVLGNIANTYQGGEITDCTDTVPAIVKETAMAAVSAVPGLSWAGVDLILETAANGVQRAAVLEVNVNAGIANFHFPFFGTPRNVARRIWETRVRASDALPAGPISTPQPRLGDMGARPSKEAPNEPETVQAGIDVAAAFAEHLASRGYALTPLDEQLVIARKGGRDHLFYGCASTLDLASVSRVVHRHTVVRRLLRRSRVPVPAGRTVTSVEELTSFLTQEATRATLIPTRGAATGAGRLVIDSATSTADLQRHLDRIGRGGSVAAQAVPDGIRLRVFATSSGGHAVLCDAADASALTSDAIVEGAKLAVRAVRAIPDLRWAAVDVVVPDRQRASVGSERAVVERVSVRPEASGDHILVAGDTAAFFDAILPDDATASRQGRRWMPQQRRWWHRFRSLTSRAQA